MKGPATSPARTLASIRQLCCLNLSETLFIPSFLDALKDWLPVHNAHFFWADPKTLQPVNYCGDGFGQMSTVRQFITHTSQRDHPGVGVAFPEIMRHHSSGTFGCEGDVQLYLQSEMYGEVMQPFDGRYVLYLVLRDVNHHPRGLMSLLRHPSDKPFSRADHQKLLQLEPYLRHAFSMAPGDISSQENQHAEGMAVLDKSGNLLYQDDTARRLLWLASHERINTPALIHLDAGVMTPELKRLHQRLVSTFEGHGALPPTLEHRNSWGRFVFRASWLEGAHGASVGVRVGHCVPRQLKLWHGIHKQELAPRQQQVALLLGEGRSLVDIASALHISRHTAAEYAEVIYKRLGISPSREALQGVLLH